ncbi:MAG: hypothetical protein CENE_01046 [Candidatus Celerinatantimonas neptuna]|nr:MAG: hypothetical protein CENE_01046 [Candidatus Celerinatantimonas neptuna]
MRLKLFTSSIALLMLAGCTSIPKLNQTHVTKIPEAVYAPTAAQLKAQMKGLGQKIVVLPFETTASSQTPYASQAYELFTQRLLNSGNTIVDRSLAKKLKGELLAAEKSGVYRKNGPNIADIAMMPKLVSLTYSKDFTEGHSWVDSKGYSRHVAPRCSFNGRAKIYVRVYRIPSMQLVNNYEYEGSSSHSSQSRRSSCPMSRGELRGLMSRAIEDAIKSGSAKTLNDIAPAAYIIERRDVNDKDGESALFMTTMNARQGAVAKAKVKIYRKEKSENPITHEVHSRLTLLGEGVMTDNIDSYGSYIYVDDEALIKKIRIGDIVKLDYGKCEPGEYELLGRCIKLPGIN